MANKMLIDATHPEETRVVVVRGNRVEEFDYESASRKQLRGNIYLAKVTRVEPSLQAAFIEYGGNRHGFLAFSEIHPDYYQIPVADRLALIEEEERAARLAEDEADLKERRRDRSRARRASPDQSVSEPAGPVEEAQIVSEDAAGAAQEDDARQAESGQEDHGQEDHGQDDARYDDARYDDARQHDTAQDDAAQEAVAAHAGDAAEPAGSARDDLSVPGAEASDETAPATAPGAETAHEAPPAEPAPAPHSISDLLSAAEAAEAAEELREAATDALLGSPLPAPQEQDGDADADMRRDEAEDAEDHPAPVLESDDVPAVSRRAAPDDGDEDEDDEDDGDVDQIDEEEEIEHLGADEDALEEVPERAPQRRARSYKIQEVIRRRQVMLVQVVKEERGNKGAALTTYLSLAGRYSVLMPNTARGGGISRKITNAVDRKRLKEVVQDLEVPEGMGIILRTAGANRTKTEIKRDFEYLLRLWETVRELTLGSAAPSLVYEEGSLIKRAIRDLYNKDIDEVHVAGEEGYREAKDFMRMLMPSHAKSVLPYREAQPIFARYGVEQQLDAMFSPVVQLKSGGYIVINPTEALVSIDVNSGRATREHHIEDTALKTNLEASEEIARQLRLRDLAGLIVIDFIDMEEKRNNRAVERKLKDCLKNDRARIQIGRISHFGLLEMSRQRIRTGVLESSIEVCPHCGGTGHVRSAASVALQLLRALEEQLLRATTHNLIARTRTEVALYVLNQKRAHLRELEERFKVTLSIAADESVTGHQPFLIEKGDLAVPPAAPPRPAAVVHPDSILPDEDYVEEEEDEVTDEASEETDAEASADAGERADDNGRRRRRRRRRRRGEREESREAGAEGEDNEDSAAESADDESGEADEEDRADDERGEGEREDENGERRKRRRGRRGGRRNRRERDGEGEGSEAEDGADGGADADMPAAAAAEAEAEAAPVAEAPAQPEAAAVEDEPPAQAERAEAAEEVVALAPAAPVAPPPAEPEAVEAKPPRRRSTVREKAPVALIAPEAAPAPAADGGEVVTADSDAAAAEAASASPAGDALAAPETKAAASAAPEADAAPPPVADTAAAGASAGEPSADEPPARKRSGWWQRKLFGE